jgi:hypothetical protein
MDDDLKASCDAVLSALRSSGGMTDQAGWEHIYSTVSGAEEAVKRLLDEGALFYDQNRVLRMKRPGVLNPIADNS